ncbi:hypothetical protein JZO73_05835 [Enterococcus plantarum]|uniref:hypothetical protein n=1 Tax=Enterococcus plantarum TaxID=1077675 RepID=UPI001A8E8209|nr:hypothetical protein [Enterococcus plantarum]MBO0467052.1 hypothetical protein [Enterococcus plantarum]
MSTTAKVLNKMQVLLTENESGLKTEELWIELLKDKELGKELIDTDGKRRNGIVVGLTTRIKNGKVENIKVVKNSKNQLVYIASANSLDFINKRTMEFINDVEKIGFGKPKDYSEDDKKIVKKYEQVIKELYKASLGLSSLSDKVEKEKIAKSNEKNTKVENTKKENKVK